MVEQQTLIALQDADTVCGPRVRCGSGNEKAVLLYVSRGWHELCLDGRLWGDDRSSVKRVLVFLNRYWSCIAHRAFTRSLSDLLDVAGQGHGLRQSGLE